METIRKAFPVLQMTCASCAVSVESMLKAQPGVVSAAVNYANATAIVEYDSQTISAEKLQKAVQSIGYNLLIEEDSHTDSVIENLQHATYIELRKRTLGAIAFSLPVFIIGMFFMHLPYANYIMWALSTPVVIWFGKDFFINAWKQAKHRSPHEMGWAMLDHANIAIAIFDRRGKIAALERGAHGLILAGWHRPAKDQTFRAATDARI